MTRIITIPTTPGFVTSDWELFRAIGVTVSPFTGKTRTQEFDAAYWSANLSLPPMKRSTASNWISFLTQLKGPTNHFLLSDPDAKTPQGTYSESNFTVSTSVNTGNSNVSIAISGANVTSSGAFSSAFAGMHIHITGATNDDNNGTHKISSKTNSNTVVLDTDFSPDLTDESFSGKIKQNVKGASAVNLTKVGSGSGTVLAGDYLGILSSNSASSNPKQLVMAVATNNSNGTIHSIQIEPKLRSDLTDGHFVNFSAPKGLFRLESNTVNWGTNRVSNYGISFAVREVV